jgi:hypothetical protein
MMANIQIIKQLIAQSIEVMKQELETTLNNSNSLGRIRSGVWIERPNTILGNVAFTPHSDPEEESIEISIIVEIGPTQANVLIDICWSDGEIVDAIVRENLLYDSQDDLYAKMINLLKNNMPTIVSRMAEQIVLDRPPRYRSN